ncbi:MAG: hypothetical protein M3P20_05245 [Thermoproteota archaeon]|nr:hypothetical protein [Thermoproteota archaeon]
MIVTGALIGLFYVQQQKQPDEGVPNVKFMTFELDKQDIAVGESTNVLINVLSSEDKLIQTARILIIIEPSGYEPFLSISNSNIEVPVFLGKDARTGEIKVSITATGSPAKEAVYVLKGMVFVEQTLSDVKEFRLTIHH